MSIGLDNIPEKASHEVTRSPSTELRIRDLSVRYSDGPTILNRIQLESSGNEVIALIGSSGAGKSTLLKSLAGLVPCQSGSIQSLGTEVTTLSIEERREYLSRVGFIWQENYLAPRLSALKNTLTGSLGQSRGLVTLLRGFSKERRSLAADALDSVAMGRLARRRADRLSGGEKQRVGIARAFMCDPDIILADEPVASLDPWRSRQILSDLVSKGRERGKLVIITLHQVELAKEFADRIVGLKDGNIVFDGPASTLTEPDIEQIYSEPHPKESDNSLASNLENAAPEPINVLDRPERLSLKTIGIFALLLLFVLSAIEATEVDLRRLAEGAPDLGDFLLRLAPPHWEMGSHTFPDFLGGTSIQLPTLIGVMFETIQMAFLGTLFGAFTAIPIALFGARNLAPHAIIYATARFLLNVNRAIPDLVYALIVVAAIGLGPFSLKFHSSKMRFDR